MPRPQPRPETIVRILPVKPIVIRHDNPVQPIAEVPRREPKNEVEPEAIRREPEPANETIRNNSPEPEKRIVSPPSGEVKKRSPLPIAPYKKRGKVGRQRKYEEVGEHGEIPICELVVHRHIRGKHFSALSKDMKRWYEFFYFVKPVEGEKPFNANTSYEQHVEAYERGRKWIAAACASEETTSPTVVEDSRIVDLEARRAIR